jgi:hypothetical protein
MCALNEDVLRHIVEYLPDETLDRINGSHSVFYQAWMKSRYASIRITKANKESKRLLAHLWYVVLSGYLQSLALTISPIASHMWRGMFGDSSSSRGSFSQGRSRPAASPKT